MSGSAVHAAGVRKAFGRVRALDGLDLDVEAGEVHGFVGPNGSGKTTTLRVLLGLLRPDAGTVRVLGGDPWYDAVELHRELAYVPGEVSLWPNLTGGEVVDLLGRMRGGTDRRRRDELLERFELDPTRRCRTYSTGNRRKVALVSALASDVPLLLFDEPTSGLDPLMVAEFRACVAELRVAGRTLLLSSHELGEVEQLCDRVSIVRAGRRVEAGSLAALRRRSRTELRVETDAPVPALAWTPGVHALEVQGPRIRCEVDQDALAGVVRMLGAAGVRAMTSRPPSLEELFLEQYEEPGAAPVGAP